MIIIKHTIKWLNPLRIDISIKNNPIIITIFNNFSRRYSKNTFIELTSIVIHVT